MTSVRTWRLLAAISASSLTLAACGGGNASDDLSASAAPSTSASASASGSSAPAKANKADGTLTIGTLLPQTGSLSSLGPPEFAGVGLAVKEINEAGGVLGKPIVRIDSDSGDTSTNIASQSVDRLLSQDADVIIGAASSGVSKTVIDKITGAGVVQISPANTSPDFTDYPDKGLYFRTAPSDVLQGRILGNKIIGDGNATVGILALQDAYGTGLSENVTKSIEGSNGEVVATVIYDPKAAEFSAEVSKIKAADPAAIVLIGFEESAKVIQELVKQGIGPQQGKELYLVDGNLEAAPVQALGDVIKGVQGTTPGAEAPGDFRQRVLAIDPSLKGFPYAGESYDAVVLVALAAEAAKSDAGKDIAAELMEVSTGGEKCTTFKACLELAKAGTDFDYDGISGPVEFDENGDPTEASVGIYTYGTGGKLLPEVEYKSGKL
ncbi:MAG: ABC transporter substrate-binding protein [Mycobacteriales bacterium]